MNQLAPSLNMISFVPFEICFASEEIPYWNLATYQHFYKTQPYDQSWSQLNQNIRRALLNLEDDLSKRRQLLAQLRGLLRKLCLTFFSRKLLIQNV
jgi:hypothetical protein